jgi:type II secretory ATPase GspE/PulE/Tfp pilus assembly ATPase PilB-like protein
MMVMDAQLRELVAAGAPHETIVAAAAAAGMRTLWEDGMEKVERGLISLDELHRVVPR